MRICLREDYNFTKKSDGNLWFYEGIESYFHKVVIWLIFLIYYYGTWRRKSKKSLYLTPSFAVV